MHPNVAHITEELARANLRADVRELEASTRTARDAATAVGCPVGAIANSLVFMADDSPILVLSSGAHRVDTGLVAKTIGAASVRPATPDEVRSATGQAIGGVAPIGHPNQLPSYVDVALKEYSTIWASAGTPHAVFSTTFEDLKRLSGATEVVVSASD